MVKAPLREMLSAYSAKNPVRLHMPGHKGKTTSAAASFDITELSFSDNLRNPKDAIAESQKFYAKTIGAKFCHYLVNGSTAGLFAMAFASGQNVLVEDTCHISLSNALKLAGKTVLTVECDKENGMALPLTLEKIQAVAENNKIDTVFITSPNYYGNVCDLKKIFKYLKAKGIKLFVDSAHGAHFGLSKLLPANAVEYCNAAVESTHKTLGSLTQSAVLLTNDEKTSQELKTFLNLFTTTSPSFLLILSIEDALVHAISNKSAFTVLFSEVENFKRRCQGLGFEFLKTVDFTRIVIDCKKNGLDARDVYCVLEKAGVVCEYASERFLIAILSLFDSGVTLDAFFTALKRMHIPEQQTKKTKNYIDTCFEKKPEKKTKK